MNKSILTLLVVFIMVMSLSPKSLTARTRKRLQLLPQNIKLAPGATLQFMAILTDKKGLVHQPKIVSWRTDGGDINREGLFYAPQEPCSVVVTAMAGDYHAWSRVTVMADVKSVVTAKKKPAPVKPAVKKLVDKKLVPKAAPVVKKVKKRPVTRNFLFAKDIMALKRWHVKKDGEYYLFETEVQVEHPAATELELFALLTRKKVRTLTRVAIRKGRTLKVRARFSKKNVRHLGVRLLDRSGRYLAATTRKFRS